MASTRNQHTDTIVFPICKLKLKNASGIVPYAILQNNKSFCLLLREFDF
jgi:hypothetical protein